jgi:hypothetical protein
MWAFFSETDIMENAIRESSVSQRHKLLERHVAVHSVMNKGRVDSEGSAMTAFES